jgi:phage tail-like protein
MSTDDTAQALLRMLPAIYREDAFLGKYLWAFEQVLLELERRVDTLDTLFNPAVTDAKFLPWLATWMAFALRADLSEKKQREFLKNVIPLYRRRGTKANLQELLSIFTVLVPTVTEDDDRPHFFHVTVVRSERDTPDELLRQRAIARALIDLEKPAHTHYELDVEFPKMQVGVFSHVGVDTLLGSGTP